MYFKIRNSLGTAALALIIAVMSSQQAIALLPLDAEAADNGMGAIPNEISLNDNADDSGLLTPPSLDNNTENEMPMPLNEEEEDEAPIPIDNGALNAPDTTAAQPANNPAFPAMNDPVAPVANNSPLGSNAPAAVPGNAGMPGLGFRPQATMPESNNFGEALLSQVDNELFNQMSDIEKQTSLLTLELRREKIKNEIAAMKAARQKAIDDLTEKEQEKERKRIEWEKEQERKLLIEEQKLKALSIALEKLRQESIVNAYKAEMLTANQKWIDNNTKLYAEIMKGEEDRDNLVKNFKMKLNHLAQMAEKAADAAETAKKNYSRELANLQTQISILKSRLEAEKTAREEINNSKKNGDKANPFASVDGKEDAPEDREQKLSDEYAIMEISGQGNELAAKLINKNGSSFMAQKGTVLQSGHIVEEITQTYIRADKKGSKDYLYFAAGGVLDREPVKALKLPMGKGMTLMPQSDDDDLEPLPALNSSQGLPSLREGMFIR